VPVDPSIPAAMYRVVGYRPSGTRAVRLDILERLADLIRPLLSWRPTPESATAPAGVQPGGGFTVTVAMTSPLASSGEDFASVLKSLGCRVERRPKPTAPAEPVAEAPAPVAPTTEASPVEPETLETADPATPADIATDPMPEPVPPTTEGT